MHRQLPHHRKRLGIAVNTVAKYVAALEEHGLIRTERTEVITRDGLKRNGCLRYTIYAMHINGQIKQKTIRMDGLRYVN